MPDDIRWEWLDRYFSGECRQEEVHAIEDWIAASPKRGRQVEALREIWTRAARAPAGESRWDAQAAWRQLEPTLEVPKPQDVGTARRRLALIAGGTSAEAARGSRRWPGYAMRIAAAITLLAGGTGVWRVVGLAGSADQERAAALREYTTPRGQRAELALTDGTRIMLAPGSTLRVPRDIARAVRRDVYLEGEAFFEVTHDEHRPFVVHAAHGTAEDLGTRFVVTAYPGDSAMRVVVTEGVVALRGRSPSTTAAPQILQPGDLGAVSRSGQLTTAHDVAVDEYVGWTTGQLVFRDSPVRDVIAALARWYDVDIRVTDTAAAARRVTLTTEPGQPLAEVLTALTVPVGLRAQWLEGTVVVGP